MLARFTRHLLRRGQDSDAWPVGLLLLAVLVPAACLLWFMGAAMSNERLATRQRLAEVYRVQLADVQARLARSWRETAADLQTLAATAPAPVAFAKIVQSGLADAVVLFDENGRISYPNTPVPIERNFGELEPKWQEAVRLEHLRNHLQAAKLYEALARETASTATAARAFQAQARCLVQAGQNHTAVELIHAVFGQERYRHAADPQGRLIAANADLMALELLTASRIPHPAPSIQNPESSIQHPAPSIQHPESRIQNPASSSPSFDSIARRLAARLTDYENPALAAPQRRFLMQELQKLAPEHARFPTWPAEQLAAAARELVPNPPGSQDFQRSALPELWQFATPNQRVLALLKTDRLRTALKTALALEPALADVNVSLLAPDLDTADAFVSLPAGDQLPGWRLALSFTGQNSFDITAGRRTTLYLWTALLAVSAMGVLTVIAARSVRRRMALGRLKNDLAATVSHELKTPVSSMRVLVDTLLDSDRLDEQQTREYLQIIARENDRLSRLIHNFLTFSRMERRKYAFRFSILAPRQVVDAALESLRGRLDGPGCQLEVKIEDDLPDVMADPDALAAALINLLENAYNYSEHSRHIALRARVEHGRVIFSVTDNGIGLTARQRKTIFQPFHQVDQRLSRKGSGCGLGLSIVQFITTAHHGTVSVESHPGCGSTFTISLPAASNAPDLGKEALA